MTDYNDGKWHPWTGGECPVHPESAVEILFKDGELPIGKAGTAYWGEFGIATIVAFRVTEEHKEPREVFLAQKPSNGIWLEVNADFDRAVKFREVTE